MSFNDVYQLRLSSWEKLLEMVKNTPPYRGTTNKYPLGARKYSNRYLLFKGDHAEVHYGNYHKSHLCNLWEDDTVEFVRDGHYGQGINQLISAFLYPLFAADDCKQGGTVIYNLDKSNKDNHPIFPGLRIHTKTMELHPSVSYKRFYNVVDRSKSKEIRAKWEDKLKSVYAFFMAGDPVEIYEDAKKLRYTEATPYNMDPYEAFLLVGASNNVFRIKEDKWARGPNLTTQRKESYDATRRHLFKWLYICENAFEEKEAEIGKAVPAGNWGVRVIPTLTWRCV